MKPIPYFTFQGNCLEAMTVYAEVFGGSVGMVMRAQDAAEHYPPQPGKEDWIMHMDVTFDDGGKLYGSDDIMGGTPPMQGMTTMMEFPTTGEAKAAYDKLADGGEISMPFGPTFWSPGFGTLRDKFGKNWMISSTEQLS